MYFSYKYEGCEIKSDFGKEHSLFFFFYTFFK
jgi:hypothetical protein